MKKSDNGNIKKEISRDVISKSKTWINKIPKLTCDNIKVRHKEIYEYINKEYDNPGSRKSHIVSLITMLKKENIDDCEITQYQKEVNKLNILLMSEQEKQKLTTRQLENYVNYEDIVRRREEYRKVCEMKPKNNKINIIHLILSLYSYIPPIRLEYSDMKIISDDKNIDETKNYIMKSDSRYIVILNNDKVTKTYGKIRYDITGELKTIINRSLENYPRDYLLTIPNNSTIPLNRQINYYLKEAFSPLNVGIQMIRSAYITHMYAENKMNISEKKKLALQMRHSKDTADLYYNKIEVCGMDKKLDKITPKDKIEKKEYLRKYYAERKNSVKTKNKNKYEQNKYDILRRKIINRINKEDSNIKKETIKKYNIKYDETKQMWI